MGRGRLARDERLILAESGWSSTVTVCTALWITARFVFSPKI